MTALSLPIGATLTLDAETLSVRHDGDVLIEQSFGRRIVRVEADGDVTLRRPAGAGGGTLVTGTILAGGTLRVSADGDADDLRGDVIEIGPVTLTAKAIVAKTRVFVAANARLNVDVIVAPEVSFDPDASGRVKLIDCLNDRPPSKVRGGLSLDDYESDLGDVAGFLARRGVTPLRPLPTPAASERSGAVTAPPAPAEVPAPTPAPAPVVATPRPPVQAPAAPPPPPAVVSAPVSAPPAPPPPAIERRPTPTLVAPVDVPDDDAPARPAPNSRQQTQLRRAWARIDEAYAGKAPAAVRRLGELLERRPHELADQLDTLWRDTLREHLVAGTQPPRVAVLGFHALRALAA